MERVLQLETLVCWSGPKGHHANQRHNWRLTVKTTSEDDQKRSKKYCLKQLSEDNIRNLNFVKNYLKWPKLHQHRPQAVSNGYAGCVFAFVVCASKSNPSMNDINVGPRSLPVAEQMSLHSLGNATKVAWYVYTVYAVHMCLPLSFYSSIPPAISNYAPLKESSDVSEAQIISCCPVCFMILIC